MNKKFFILIILFVFFMCSCNTKKVSSVEITWDSIKTEYEVNDTLPTDDIKVKVNYNDGSSEYKNDYEVLYYDTDMSVEGYKSITVTYVIDGERYNKSFSFNVSKKHELKIVEKDVDEYYLYTNEINVRKDDLVVTYDGEIINNYTLTVNAVEWNNNEGKQRFDITYMKEKTSFYINYIKECEYEDYTEKLKNIKFNSYITQLTDVHDGGSRQTNYLVCYKENNIVARNIYGYECAIDASGKIIEMAKNVSLPKGGMVLSAHGTAQEKIKNLKIGQYVFYVKGLQSVFIYDDLNIDAYYLSAYNRMDTLYKTYINSNSTILGLCKDEAIALYDAYMKYDTNDINTVNDFEEKYEILENKINDNIKCELEYYNKDMFIDSPNISKIEVDKNDYCYVTTIAISHENGFRNTDEIVYYGSTKNTNIHGIEVAVDKDGYVIDIATNTDIPSGGFVISGHGAGKTTLSTSIMKTDLIVYDKDNSCIKVYRNVYKALMDEYYDKINNLYSNLNNYYQSNKIAYYASAYRYLSLSISEYQDLASQSYNDGLSLYNLYKLSNNQIDNYLLKAYYYALENDPVVVKAFWHTPGNVSSSGYDETTYEGLCAFLDTVKLSGFNRMYVNVLCHGTTFYDSEILEYRNEAYHHTYGEYKDYLECLINEANKRGIEVFAWAITMDFRYCEVLDDSYYTYDIYGNKSGTLDSTNPKVQDFLCDVFEELAAYDLKGIEYDYIRYSSSNEGFTEYAMNAFKKENKLNGDLKELLNTVSGLSDKWKEFKQNGITDSIKKINASIKSVNSDCIITAAVFNSTGAKDSVMQDWMKWYTEGLVDELEPMLYTADNVEFVNMMDKWLAGIDYEDTSINIGISPMINSGEYLDYPIQMSYIQERNLSTCIFYSGAIFNSSQLLDILKTLNNESVTYDASEETKLNKTKEYLIEVINEYYIPRYDLDFTSLLNVLNNDGSNVNDIINSLNSLDINSDIIKELYRIVNKIK